MLWKSWELSSMPKQIINYHIGEYAKLHGKDTKLWRPFFETITARNKNLIKYWKCRLTGKCVEIMSLEVFLNGRSGLSRDR